MTDTCVVTGQICRQDILDLCRYLVLQTVLSFRRRNLPDRLSSSCRTLCTV